MDVKENGGREVDDANHKVEEERTHRYSNYLLQ